MRAEDSPYQIELEDIQAEDVGDTAAKPGHDRRESAIEPTEYRRRLSEEGPRPWNGEWLVDRRRVLTARLLVCGVAIALLWCTTLNMAQSIVSTTIPAPTLTQVFQQWAVAWNVEQQQKSDYENCATGQIARCNSDLNATMDKAISKINQASSDNAATLQLASYRQLGCATAFYTINLKIKAWAHVVQEEKNYSCVSATPDPVVCSSTWPGVYRWTSTCANDTNQIDTTTQLLVDSGDVQAQAYSQSTTYARQTQALAGLTDQQVNAYIDYNYNYLGDKVSFMKVNFTGLAMANMDFPPLPNLNISVTLPDLTNLYGCLGIGPNCSCSTCTTMRSLYNAVSLNISNAAAAIKAQQQAAYQQAQSLINSTEDFLATLNAFMVKVQDANAKLKSLVPGDVNIIPDNLFPCGCNTCAGTQQQSSCLGVLGDLNFMNSQFNLPNWNLNLPSANSLYGSLASTVSQVSATVGNKISSATTAVNKQVSAFGNATEAAVQNGLQSFNGWNFTTDYNPPGVNTYSSNYSQLTADFLLKQKYALDQLNQPNYTGSNGSTVAAAGQAAITYVQAGLSNTISAAEGLAAYKSLNGNIDIEPLINLSGLLSVFSMSVDYSWRVFRTVWYIVRYWSYSAVGLPEIDVRKFRTTEKTPTRVRVARLITSPFVLVAAGAFALFFIVVGVASVYVPILQQYSDGCVNGKSGTILVNNTYSIFYNNARLSGDNTVSDGLRDFDKRRGQLCGSYQQSTIDDQNKNNQQLSVMKLDFGDTVSNWGQIGKCVDMSTFYYFSDDAVVSTLYDNALANVPGARPRPVTLQIDAECTSHKMDQYQMEDATFNCSVIDATCSDSCSGPNEAIIFDASLNCGCYTEWMLHANILRVCFTVFVWICWQMCRSYIISGITRLYWRSLTPEGFTFRGSCDREGKPNDTFLPDLQDQLRGMIKAFERGAYFYFAFAVFVHIPYIILIVLARKNITYSAS